jgi:hypothetical protein
LRSNMALPPSAITTRAFCGTVLDIRILPFALLQMGKVVPE